MYRHSRSSRSRWWAWQETEQFREKPSRLAVNGLEDEGEVRGFHALVKFSPSSLELDALFVAPEHVGRGYGRALMSDALRRAEATEHIERLVIQAPPGSTSRPAGA